MRVTSVNVAGKTPVTIAVYDDVSDAAKYVSPTYHPRSKDADNPSERGFYGAGFDDTVNGMVSGRADVTSAVKSRLSKLRMDVSIATPMLQYNSAMAGPRLHVGRYVSGLPDVALRRRNEDSELGPLNVVVHTTVSADTAAGAIMNRGAAVISLLEHLVAVRPVNLYAMSAMQINRMGGLGLVRLSSNPVNVAQAAYMFCTPSASRVAGLALAWAPRVKDGLPVGSVYRHSIQWLTGHVEDCDNAALRRENISLEQYAAKAVMPYGDFLYLGPAMSTDNSELMSDPTGWLRRMVDIFGHVKYE